MQEAEREANEGRNNELQALADSIKEEELAQWRADGQELLLAAKRENVLLQLEAAYRERAMQVYSEASALIIFSCVNLYSINVKRLKKI